MIKGYQLSTCWVPFFCVYIWMDNRIVLKINNGVVVLLQIIFPWLGRVFARLIEILTYHQVASWGGGHSSVHTHNFLFLLLEMVRFLLFCVTLRPEIHKTLTDYDYGELCGHNHFTRYKFVQTIIMVPCIISEWSLFKCEILFFFFTYSFLKLIQVLYFTL